MEAGCTRLGDMLLETQVRRERYSKHPYMITSDHSIWAKLEGRGLATQHWDVVYGAGPQQLKS